MRALLGVVLRDLPRYYRGLRSSDRGYLSICNREERLDSAPAGPGYRCAWQWTSDLHAPKIIPSLGRILMERALSDHPIALAQQPRQSGDPRVSFVIGHRGTERIPLLQATLASIAAQADVPVEAIVVEQSAASELGGVLPSWVSHVHCRTDVDAPYNRAWAFNVGAAHARGATLVLHDNDLLVPKDYAAEIEAHVARGFEVVNLKRFIFYLGERESSAVCSNRSIAPVAPEAVMQNALGGGSLAVCADTYARLGGMDEGFVGWGGEDNEFWERCGTARRWEFGYLSLVHLWHRSQPQKTQAENPTMMRYWRLAEVDPHERIRRLEKAPRGGALARSSDPFSDLFGINR